MKQDYSKAREWYDKAAKQEHAGAQCNLGVMYNSGHGGEQDYSKAREWYEKAAKQEHASAQYNLGIMYENCRGVEQSDSNAMRWYGKAAAQGNKKAEEHISGILARASAERRANAGAQGDERGSCGGGGASADAEG